MTHAGPGPNQDVDFVFVATPEGLLRYNPDSDSISTARDAPGALAVADVDVIEGGGGFSTVYYMEVERDGANCLNGAVRSRFFTDELVTSGGSIRCPLSIAARAGVGGPRVYVGDAEDSDGGGARILEIALVGEAFQQSVLVDLPGISTYPAGIAFASMTVPEPATGLGGSTAILLYLLARRRAGAGGLGSRRRRGTWGSKK